MYEKGHGVDQNYREAFKWFQRSAVGGDVFAQFRLALLYIQGLGVEENYHEAKMWLCRSADAGVPIAQELLEDIRRDEAEL
jgi:TPR repeat protein